jgi:hypothetical protein
VAPWSNFWDRNMFGAALPGISGILASPYARGAVSGLGLVTVLGGIAELGGAFASRRAASDSPNQPGLPSDR